MRGNTRIGWVPVAIVLVFGMAGTAHAGDGTTTVDAVVRAVDTAWVLVAAALVFFMQAGFALLGAGLIRSKNTVNYLTKSFMDFCIGGLAFWAFGFALMFGGSAAAPGLDHGTPLIGQSGFFLLGPANHPSTMLLWLFQMVFAATAATIVAGAVAERMKLQAYLAYSFLVSGIIYPIYGHWVWGNGWLANLGQYLPFLGADTGAVDFAGSGVVHAVGGLVALVAARMVGPRIGKFNPDGSANVFPGHNMVYVVTGTFILFFGWFGFNAGSTLAAMDPQVSTIAVNTLLAGAAGAVTALYFSLIRTGKADIVMACNGALAGLVGITAPCAYVPSWAAVVIGFVAAMVMIGSLRFVEHVLHVDDVVGAVSVHGGAGLWGLLAVGIFADGSYGGVRGLIVGEWTQFVAQLISIVTVTAWSLVTGYILFGMLRNTIGLRVSPAEERAGLDVPEHGVETYPEGRWLTSGIIITSSESQGG